MFNIDKEKLKEHMKRTIQNEYVAINYSYGSDPMSQAITKQIIESINLAVHTGVKELIITAVDELIDQLYTVNDMEKDLGLK